MEIDVKELRPVKPNEELEIDGYFYIKQENGEYHVAHISSFEYDLICENTPWEIERILWEWNKLIEEGKVFLRRNKPFQNFGLSK